MTLIEIEDWLATMPTKVPVLKEVVFGDEQEILDRQNSRIKYPLMWVETATPTFLTSPPATRFRFALTFLQNVASADNRRERIARSEMLTAAEAVMLELERGQDEGRWQFEPGGNEGDALLKWSGDRDTGWRFEFSLTVGRDDC